MPTVGPGEELLRDIRIMIAVTRQRDPWVFRNLLQKDRPAREAAEDALSDRLREIVMRYDIKRDERRIMRAHSSF